ncbi:5316_t:CDS:1 [Ambispora gerdemannii]|uniref:5316_t:CDS:1 n=1 Tax=Ambispora gerdemannii TaxID=144530 RepID=A0A9N8ZW40_9GLOM|nr:5316_t:CDS:1 [Ambispora gerdemannii]
MTSYNTSPRSPVPLIAVDNVIVSSPGSDYSDRSSNSPRNEGRRLRVHELLDANPQTSSSSAPFSFQLPSISSNVNNNSLDHDNMSIIAASLSFSPHTSLPPINSTNPRFVQHLQIPDTSSHLFASEALSSHNQLLLSPSTSSTPNSAITPTQPPPSPLLYGASPTMSSPGTQEDQNDQLSPLTLHERRERNKVASAKYRAKKHKQTQEMSTQIAELNSRISALTAENGLLCRQVQELKNENIDLKGIVDDLKSQLVEDKILKRLGRSGVASKNSLKTSTTVAGKRERARHGNSGHAKGTLGNNKPSS